MLFAGFTVYEGHLTLLGIIVFVGWAALSPGRLLSKRAAVTPSRGQQQPRAAPYRVYGFVSVHATVRGSARAETFITSISHLAIVGLHQERFAV